MVKKASAPKTQGAGPNRGMLRRKLLRDLRDNAMQFIAMLLLCCLGTFVFSGMDRVMKALLPITQPLPMTVSPPKMEAPE